MEDDPHTRLRKARIDRGFKSAREAARRYGWAVSTYASHENGTRNFDAEAAVTYARAFKVPPEWLLLDAGPGAKIAGAEAIAATIHRIQGLRKDHADAVVSVIFGYLNIKPGERERTGEDDQPGSPTAPHAPVTSPPRA